MKNASDLTESEDSDSSSAAPQPFNLFAGLQEEQLPSNTAQTLAHTNIPPPQPPQKAPEGVTVASDRGIYLVIAAIVVLIILILAAL